MKPQYIDIHSHVNFAIFDEDRDAVIKRALDAGIWMINVGTKYETSKKAVEITAMYEYGVYSIVGLHPIHTNASYHDKDEIGEEGKPFSSKGEVFDKDAHRDLIAKSSKGKIVGIGECGLDYYRSLTKEEHERQRGAFISQIELAIELDLPLMLHIRSGEEGNAYKDVLDILTFYKREFGDRLRGNAHFFAGTVDDAKKFLDLGFYLSYTGVVTFAKQYKELVEYTPLNRIMSETDCPYVSPVPERGKRNEPDFVRHIADAIAIMKEGDIEENKEQMVKNAFKIWGI